ncbi:hypothetical protein [Halovivax cerinus]|uniref:Uncharacterized protein n=1 Tax=Halovivax cerinus TaxID=1487865 RepID=A0ABD5NP11_9EURY|nr:hypothetical protein [Halovivax cerinus]
MGEKKYTLLELHLDGDTQIGPGTVSELLTGGDADTDGIGPSPSASSSDADAAGVGTSPAEDEEGESGRRLFPLVAGTIAMIAIAVAVRRYRRDDGAESLDERDVVVN